MLNATIDDVCLTALFLQQKTTTTTKKALKIRFDYFLSKSKIIKLKFFILLETEPVSTHS